jgi:23S rRNA (guanine2445-N2)-methyltransferase / 23S rRNA (guanine2069-N7)-methyltransferase
LFVSTPKGLAGALRRELDDLGITAVRTAPSGVLVAGSLAEAYRICLWSRLANRVLMPLASFPAPTPDELYGGSEALAWEEHLGADGTLAVDCTAVHSAIGHSHYAALKVKDAICDRLRRLSGRRPSVELVDPDVRIHLHLRGARAELSLDLSGTSLHQRGYRCAGGEAPMKENLAAGVLLLAGWPRVAAAGGSLIDPLCGSGTLLVEAALMAAGVAPGLGREYFGFLRWRGHDAALWSRLREEAQGRRRSGLERLPSILGFDADGQAVAAARRNIERAGLASRIRVERRTLESAMPWQPGEQGLVVTNPPYGERLGEQAALRVLYARLGARLRQETPGWRAAILTANPELAAYVGRVAEASHTLYNGRLECRLLIYPPAGRRPPAVTRMGDAAGFANRLRKNLRHLARWARRTGVDCFRVYDADLPEFAFAIDLYHASERWVHVQEYQAPGSIDPERALFRLQAGLAVLPEVLDVPLERIFLKTRRRQRGKAQYQPQGASGRFIEVREHDCRFWVNLSDYLDTGLFLDHRITRAMIADLAAGKRFLNLFSYTAAATVHAARGGARTTTSVDLSQTYLEWARRNLELNGIRGPDHGLIRADCVAWLEREAREGARAYDLIFLDPPTFSNSKRMARSLDVQRDHVALIRAAATLLRPGGQLVFSTNARRFRLAEAALGPLMANEISATTLPEDFARNPKIHRCWIIARPEAHPPAR